MKYIAFAAAMAATPAFADQPVSINFAGEIAGKPFACTETFDGVGAKATAVKGIDYRLFVSGAALIRADGTAQPIALEQQMLEGMRVVDGQTQIVLSPEATMQLLEEVRRTGYAITRGELEAGLDAIAAPVRDETDEVIAALGLSGPSVRITDHEALGALLTHEADLLSQALKLHGTGGIAAPEGANK